MLSNLSDIFIRGPNSSSIYLSIAFKNLPAKPSQQVKNTQAPTFVLPLVYHGDSYQTHLVGHHSTHILPINPMSVLQNLPPQHPYVTPFSPYFSISPSLGPYYLWLRLHWNSTSLTYSYGLLVIVLHFSKVSLSPKCKIKFLVMAYTPLKSSLCLYLQSLDSGETERPDPFLRYSMYSLYDLRQLLFSYLLNWATIELFRILNGLMQKINK